ncbi:MAG: hypothetical protein CM15mP115_18980 [Alphaproteobacteria bacterium]|nr:MAG: hypothetical protein CM15mP115_18980 [Alphaproteobacteria bacterium]
MQPDGRASPVNCHQHSAVVAEIDCVADSSQFVCRAVNSCRRAGSGCLSWTGSWRAGPRRETRRPEEPELEEVDADDEAVDELDSPALSVDVCDAVSQAATKKATAASAIRRCNMVMLPVFNPGLSAIRLSGGCPMNSPVLTTVAPFMSINRSLEDIRRWPYENKPIGAGDAPAHKSRHLLAQISDN